MKTHSASARQLHTRDYLVLCKSSRIHTTAMAPCSSSTRNYIPETNRTSLRPSTKSATTTMRPKPPTHPSPAERSLPIGLTFKVGNKRNLSNPSHLPRQPPLDPPLLETSDALHQDAAKTTIHRCPRSYGQGEILCFCIAFYCFCLLGYGQVGLRSAMVVFARKGEREREEEERWEERGICACERREGAWWVFQ